MKRPQVITIGVAVILVGAIYFFGRTTPLKKISSNAPAAAGNSSVTSVSADTLLNMAKRQLTKEQLVRITTIENSISRGAVRDQQLQVYHQLAHFWGDSIGFFIPYAWYEAEAARLENSEKTLTFAARLFLDYLQGEQNPDFRKWEALQAKDLFERSLKINPENDSSKVGLGACYLFGNISETPMEGISKIRAVAEKDSTDTYAQIMLAKGSVLSGQYDKAVSRLLTIIRVRPNDLEAILMLADVSERMGEKENAVKWYKRSLDLVNRPDVRSEIEKRIEDLKSK